MDQVGLKESTRSVRFEGSGPMTVRAMLLGARIDLRVIEAERLASFPVTVSLDHGAYAFLFRYGVAVFFGAGKKAEESFLARVRPALAGKLRLISDTLQTALNVLQQKSSLRMEWYIVVLILVEILLTLYQMFS